MYRNTFLWLLAFISVGALSEALRPNTILITSGIEPADKASYGWVGAWNVGEGLPMVMLGATLPGSATRVWNISLLGL